ncbi:MAG: glycosyltransferase family 4 protein [Candidatus Omnitrophica bacterium]|nr:glycosyltransferase family 4 protein [Candidatus Omnitrophota bacterium]
MTKPEQKRPIRVVHIITRLIIGGAQENTLLTVFGLQLKGGYEVTLLSGPTTGPEGSLVEKALKKTTFVILPELRRRINLFFDLIAFIKLYFFIKNGRFDIVHTHSSKAGILGRLAAKLAKAPIIIHTIHGLPFYEEQPKLLNNFYFYLERYASSISDKLICVSQTLIDEAVRRGLAGREKFIKIYSGIELSLYVKNPQAKEALKKKLGIPQTSPVIGKVARLFLHKGHEYLIQAAALIKEKCPEAKILFIGDGILKDELIRLAQRLGVRDMIVFAGLIMPESIPYYIQLIDVIAHASLHEGLPRAVVQGYALGIPAVCFDIDGARDIVHDKTSGYLVEPKNVRQFAERLIDLLQNKDKAKKMGAEGERFVRESFDAQVMVSAIDFVYRELIRCGT